MPSNANDTGLVIKTGGVAGGAAAVPLKLMERSADAPVRVRPNRMMAG